MQSIAVDGKLLDTQKLKVASGANLNVVLTYSRKVASLNGSIQVSENQPRANAVVVLLSEDEHPLGNRIFQVDQDLQFSAKNLKPGKYLVVATNDGQWDLWHEQAIVDAVRPQAQEIELHENENATLTRLTLIAKDEIERINQRLGL